MCREYWRVPSSFKSSASSCRGGTACFKSSVKTATAGALLLQDSELARAASKLDTDRASACSPLQLRTHGRRPPPPDRRKASQGLQLLPRRVPAVNPTTYRICWLFRSTIADHKGEHRSTESNSKCWFVLEWPVNQRESSQVICTLATKLAVALVNQPSLDYKSCFFIKKINKINWIRYSFFIWCRWILLIYCSHWILAYTCSYMLALEFAGPHVGPWEKTTWSHSRVPSLAFPSTKRERR